MNRGQYQSEIKEEERSAMENVKDEGKRFDRQGRVRADDKVLVKLPRKFCKEIKKYLKSGKIATFYEMKLPKKFNYIDGINVGGGSFYPVVMFPDKFNDSLMCASFLKDWKIQIKLEDGEVLKTTPENLQKCISEGYQKYKEADINLEKEIEKTFNTSFLVINEDGINFNAKNSTPVYMLETDIAEKIGNYAVENGIGRLDQRQVNAVNGTVKDLKALFIEAKENELSSKIEKDNEKIEKENIKQKDLGEEI